MILAPAAAFDPAALEAARDLVQRSSVQSETAGETTVRLGQPIPTPGGMDDTLAAEWAEVLDSTSPQAALAAAVERLGELRRELGSAVRRAAELEGEVESLRLTNDTLALLAMVASKTDSAVVIMDRHGLVEWVNAGFVRMTGYEPSEALGRRPADLLHGPLTDPDTAREIEAAFETAGAHNQEILHYRKDGGTYWASVSITPVFDEEGDLTRWIAIASDVTRRRQAQEALQHAREAAEAASRAKSEFLANMSHEIRTPMNAVIGMTELALCTELSPEQREYLATAKQSAESLLGLLNDILDLSKIEAGKLEIDWVAFDLGEVLDETMKPLAARAGAKGLEMSWHLPPDVQTHLAGDPVRLRQILINLVDNAIKFTRRGKVSVSVEPQWQTENEVGLHFAVSDTGIGIPADKLDRIFEGFTQGDSSTARQFGGTGLGLTISSQLIELMQGRIWVQSKVGRGSTFHFSLRFEIQPAPDLGRAATAAASADRPVLADETAPTPLRILVADDNAANRVLAEKVLQKRGHRVVAVAGGRAVLRALARDGFDIVLMDVQMPDLDGFAATAVIRENEKATAQHLPIVAMTAYAMQGDRQRCLDAGMDAYLAKPVRAKELIAMVEALGGAASGVCRADLAPPAGGDFDFGPALARLEGDDEILKEQMQLFLRDAPLVLADVHAAVAGREGKALQRAAHRLKGLAAGFDVHQAVSAAGQLEASGRDGDFHEAEAVAGQLQGHVDSLRAALEAFLATA